MKLRHAELADAEILLQWRNDKDTRHASHNSAPVSRESHLAWLKKVIDDQNWRLFIAEENGVAVGTVRAVLVEGAWELSWTVAPEARGRGMAKKMVALLDSQVFGKKIAQVKKENLASARIAESIGMVFECERDGVLFFIKP